MQQHQIENLVHIVARIDFVKEQAVHHRAIGHLWGHPKRQRMQEVLREALVWLDDLSLTTTKTLCSQLVNDLSYLGMEGAMAKADYVRQALEAELKTRMFFVLHLEHIKYYTWSPSVFGEAVAKKFPTADREGAQAGKCFALGRNTACVYHLMRAMEVGLKALAKKLGAGRGPNWGDYLRDIETELKKAATPRKSKNRAFYAGCAAQFAHVKNAWRNPVMHIEETYDETEAQDIFNAVTAFLRHLATKLKEPPPKAAQT